MAYALNFNDETDFGCVVLWSSEEFHIIEEIAFLVLFHFCLVLYLEVLGILCII
jgi:hypothetical protein